MSTQKLIGVLIYGIVSFFLGWVIYGMALMNFMTAHTTQYAGLMKTEMDASGMIILFLANIAWGGLAVQVVSAMKAYSFMDAFKKTIPVVLCVMLGIDLGYMAFMNLYDWTWIIVDMIVGTVMWSVCNGILGWWLGRGETKAA